MELEQQDAAAHEINGNSDEDIDPDEMGYEVA